MLLWGTIIKKNIYTVTKEPTSGQAPTWSLLSLLLWVSSSLFTQISQIFHCLSLLTLLLSLKLERCHDLNAFLSLHSSMTRPWIWDTQFIFDFYLKEDVCTQVLFLFLFIMKIATVIKHPEIALNPDCGYIWYATHEQHCWP